MPLLVFLPALCMISLARILTNKTCHPLPAFSVDENLQSTGCPLFLGAFSDTSLHHQRTEKPENPSRFFVSNSAVDSLPGAAHFVGATPCACPPGPVSWINQPSKKGEHEVRPYNTACRQASSSSLPRASQECSVTALRLTISANSRLTPLCEISSSNRAAKSPASAKRA